MKGDVAVTFTADKKNTLKILGQRELHMPGIIVFHYKLKLL